MLQVDPHTVDGIIVPIYSIQHKDKNTFTNMSYL